MRRDNVIASKRLRIRPHVPTVHLLFNSRQIVHTRARASVTKLYNLVPRSKVADVLYGWSDNCGPVRKKRQPIPSDFSDYLCIKPALTLASSTFTFYNANWANYCSSSGSNVVCTPFIAGVGKAEYKRDEF